MKKQTAGRKNLGELAPKFAELNDDVLFGEVWSREDKLSLRDRSMITISALMAQGLFPQLKSHFILGKEHGGVFGQGEPNVNFAKYFIGNSYLRPPTKAEQIEIAKEFAKS